MKTARRTSNFVKGGSVRRLVPAIALLVATILVVATAWFVVGSETAPPADQATDDAPAPPQAPPPHVDPPAVVPTRAKSTRETPRAATPQPTAPTGRLEVRFRYRAELDDLPATATLFFPTGEEIATETAANDVKHCTFERAPAGVPLVLRVSAPRFLTGLCCDVVVPADEALTKSVSLIEAPVVRARVLDASSRRPIGDVRVDLVQRGELVAGGWTKDDGIVAFRVPTVGKFRVRLSSAGYATPPESALDVRAGDEVVDFESTMSAGGSVEIAVATPDGKPARGAEVWLVGDISAPLKAIADARGVATFAGLSPGLELTAVARAKDLGARAAVRTRDDATQRVPLVLKTPAPLAGFITDVGGATLAGATIEVIVHPYDEPIVVRSDAAGHFATPPLPAGLADVTVRRDGFIDGSPEQPVVIEPVVGGFLTMRLLAAPTGAVVVAVRDAAGGPLKDAAVTLFPSHKTGVTAADGLCRIDGLPAGADQSIVARMRGYRAARPASASPPVVRVVQDVATSAEIALSSVAGPPPVGGASATGVVLDSDGRPVVAARVVVGAASTRTDVDGTFHLDSIARPKDAGAVAIRVVPGPGLLEPFECFVDVDPSGVAALGTVRLRSRPYARLRLPSETVETSSLKREKSKSMRRVRPGVETRWLAFDHDDELLGVRTRRFEPIAFVSYDRTWLHLPPADDWKRVGRGEVFIATATPRGLLTGRATWTQTADARAGLTLSYEPTGKLVVFSTSKELAGRSATFTQLACASLFDPRSVRVPSGETPLPVDPFASLADCRSFTIENFHSGDAVAYVAPGRWRIDVGGLASIEASVPDDTIVSLDK